MGPEIINMLYNEQYLNDLREVTSRSIVTADGLVVQAQILTDKIEFTVGGTTQLNLGIFEFSWQDKDMLTKIEEFLSKIPKTRYVDIELMLNAIKKLSGYHTKKE